MLWMQPISNYVKFFASQCGTSIWMQPELERDGGEVAQTQRARERESSVAIGR